MCGRSFAGLLIGKRLTTEHSEKGDFCGIDGKWPQSKEPGEGRFFSGNENYIPYLLSVPRQPAKWCGATGTLWRYVRRGVFVFFGLFCLV